MRLILHNAIIYKQTKSSQWCYNIGRTNNNIFYVLNRFHIRINNIIALQPAKKVYTEKNQCVYKIIEDLLLSIYSH